jgi:hypothetical protein
MFIFQDNPTKRVGRYSITLRLPADGVFAGEQIDIEFRLRDESDKDPVLGAKGVVGVKSVATVTMPSMAGMPAQKPRIHTEGIPGDYGVECFFPHGGEYRIALTLQIPGEKTPIDTAFLVDVQDAEARTRRKPVPLPYSVECAVVGGGVSGKETNLKLIIREAKSKKIVKDFDVAHTKIFHLMFISKDFSWFIHEHPTQQPDGSFTITQVFPFGGEFLVFADVAPRDAGSQVLGTRIKLKGNVPKPVPFAPTPPTAIVDGIRATLTPQESPMPIGKTTMLEIKLTIEGKPVTDLETYLGAFGHLMILHSDQKTFVHSHPAEDEKGIAESRRGNVLFAARFPKAGQYKAWAQFQREGVVITFPFVFVVGGGR